MKESTVLHIVSEWKAGGGGSAVGAVGAVGAAGAAGAPLQ
jgi:hypothetical protein